jgi:hypothetical protein
MARISENAGQGEASKAANASQRRRMADACAVNHLWWIDGLEAFLEP